MIRFPVGHVHLFVCDRDKQHVIPTACREILALCPACGSKGENMRLEVVATMTDEPVPGFEDWFGETGGTPFS